MNIGDKVAVHITDVESWTRDALIVVQGQVGTVKEIKTVHNRGKDSIPIAPRVLVTFDPPLPPTWKWGSPNTGFWFDLDELEPA